MTALLRAHGLWFHRFEPGDVPWLAKLVCSGDQAEHARWEVALELDCL